MCRLQQYGTCCLFDVQYLPTSEQACTCRKKQAVGVEDYDAAKSLKTQIDALRQQAADSPSTPRGRPPPQPVLASASLLCSRQHTQPGSKSSRLAASSLMASCLMASCLMGPADCVILVHRAGHTDLKTLID